MEADLEGGLVAAAAPQVLFPARWSLSDIRRLNTRPRRVVVPLLSFVVVGVCYLLGLALVLLATFGDFQPDGALGAPPRIRLDDVRCRVLGVSLYVLSVALSGTWLMRHIERLRWQQMEQHEAAAGRAAPLVRGA
jgi:hypothetical protein